MIEKEMDKLDFSEAKLNSDSLQVLS